MGITARALTNELFDTTRVPAMGAGTGRQGYQGIKEYAREYVAKIKDYVMGFARKRGYIPDYHRTRHIVAAELEEPQYMTHPEIQAETTRPLVRRMREFYGNNFDMAPYISRVKESIGMLPVYGRLAVGRTKDGSIGMGLVPAGVVQGVFDQKENQHTYSPLLLSPGKIREVYRNEPQKAGRIINMKEWLESFGFHLSSPEQVKAHEYGHHFQKVSGALDRYREKGERLARRLKDRYLGVPEEAIADHISRAYIEGANTTFTNRMLGEEDRVYPRERRLFRKLADEWGELRAYLGHVPDSDLEPALAGA